jgi:hypothetical protein
MTQAMPTLFQTIGSIIHYHIRQPLEGLRGITSFRQRGLEAVYRLERVRRE